MSEQTFESLLAKFKSINSNPLAFIILDLDGVLLRHPVYHTINTDDYSIMGKSFAQFLKAGGKIGIISNRTPAEMQIVAYFMGVHEGIWVTESGGSAYDVGRNTSIVLPKWEDYASKKVPYLRSLLEKELGIGHIPTSFQQAQYIPSLAYIKTIIIPPSRISNEEFAHETIIPFLKKNGLLKHFQVNIGKAIDIDPKELSKGPGIIDLLQLNAINPSNVPTLFIADHTRDIPGARTLMSLGGKIAAVGNAEEDYKQFIRENGGLIAPKTSEYHNSVTYLIKSFLETV